MKGDKYDQAQEALLKKQAKEAALVFKEGLPHLVTPKRTAGDVSTLEQAAIAAQWAGQFFPSAGKGLRFNQGKTRHDLVPAFAQEQYAKVLTKGAEKYAERNWENGMPWSKVTASLKRHISAFERGEDVDPETGLLHMAHVMCNAAFLVEYYNIFPQGDDRPIPQLRMPKIGLDIDEVLADWVGHWTKHHGQEVPETWNFDKDIAEKFKTLKDDKDFWMSIPPKVSASDLHFEPHCYITSRSIPTEWTEEWIKLHGFPTVKVISLTHGVSKVEACKAAGIDIFVDDRYENFVELNNAGIFTYLMDAPHNKRYEVGHRRLHRLSEICNRAW